MAKFLTVHELGTASGVCPRTITKIELGERGRCQARILRKIAESLGVNPSVIVD